MNKEYWNRLGFCISDVDGKLEVQRIDSPREWAADHEMRFIPPLLPNDDVARDLAINEGFEFNDKGNIYLVTKWPDKK